MAIQNAGDTEEILGTAVNTAVQQGIQTILVASTTGATALQLLPLIAGKKIKLIVVATRNPKNGTVFEEEIRTRLLDEGMVLYSKPPEGPLSRRLKRLLYKIRLSPFQNHLRRIQSEHGTGMRVCYKIAQMTMRAGLLNSGRIIAVAGTRRGADCAAMLEIKPGARWPALEQIIMQNGSGRVKQIRR